MLIKRHSYQNYQNVNADSLVDFICLHFNHCRDIGEFPQELKHADTMPVHKKKEKKWYRPVSIHPKKTPQVQNRYLGVLIDLSFQGIKRLFVLSFKDDDCRKSYKQHYLPTVEMKDYYVVIDRRNFFDRPITPYQK